MNRSRFYSEVSGSEANRELNRQVAQSRGWVVETGTTTYDNMEMPWEVWITDPARKDEDPFKRAAVTINPIPYSTDLAAAWTLVEAMMADGYLYGLGNLEYKGPLHEAAFYRDGRGPTYAEAETPAAAIVQAYLKAKERNT